MHTHSHIGEKTPAILARISSEPLALGFFSGLVALADNNGIKQGIRALESRKIEMRKAHEIILQSYLFCGFPRMLDALFNLAELVSPDEYGIHSKIDLDHLQYTDAESREFERRGRELIQEVYADHYPKLEAAITGMSPEVFRLMIMEGYGKTLSRPGLDVKTRELAVVAALTVDGKTRQLKAHIRGALNVGVAVNDLDELLNALSEVVPTEPVQLAKRLLTEMTQVSK